MSNDHLRRLSVFVDEPDPGDFYWVLHESTDDASVWLDVSSSEECFDSWMAAFRAGWAELMKMVPDAVHGPRAVGEDENASPVGPRAAESGKHYG